MMHAMGRPSATSWTIDDDWKTNVAAAMKVLRISQRALAAELGVNPGLVSRMLKPIAQGGLKNSSHAARVVEIVGVPLPVQAKAVDLTYQKLLAIQAMSPTVFRDIEAEIEEKEAKLRALHRR